MNKLCNISLYSCRLSNHWLGNLLGHCNDNILSCLRLKNHNLSLKVPQKKPYGPHDSLHEAPHNIQSRLTKFILWLAHLLRQDVKMWMFVTIMIKCIQHVHEPNKVQISVGLVSYFYDTIQVSTTIPTLRYPPNINIWLVL